MDRGLRYLRGIEGMLVTIAGTEFLREFSPSTVAPGLTLTLGIVYAAARGGAFAGALGVVLGTAYFVFYEASRSTPIGTALTAEVTFAVVTAITAAVVSYRGRHAARRIAEERGHAERLEELEQAKSAFLRLASHELRGPLGIISGYVALLEDGSFGPPASADTRVALPVLRGKVAEMQTLVDSLLEQARLEDVGGVLDRHPIDVRDIVDDAVAAIRPIATQQHEIRWERPRGAVVVNADATRLQLIVTGLLHNAVKFSPGGGVVAVFVSARDGWAVVTVWDHGLGIAERHLPQLFTRFGRIVTPENAHIGGIGLGLYLARELARLHGGEISVQSSEGRGTTFTLRIPLSTAALDRPDTAEVELTAAPSAPAPEATRAAEPGDDRPAVARIKPRPDGVG